MFTTLNTKGAINVFKILRGERLEPSPLYHTRDVRNQNHATLTENTSENNVPRVSIDWNGV